MSVNSKRKLASLQQVQSRVDNLVGNGDIVLGVGKRLKVQDDGLPQVTDLDGNPVLLPSYSPRKRLINIVNYLESPNGPKSVGWCKALTKLHHFLRGSVGGILLDGRVWDACEAANDEATDDIAYMDMLYHILRYGDNADEWVDKGYEVYQFPQRACRLLGIESLGEFSWEAWDDGLADQMLKKDLEAYRLIHRGFHHLQEIRECEKGFGKHSADQKASKYIKLFLELEPMKAIEAVVETDEFLMVERKGKTSKRVQEAIQARKAEGTQIKSEDMFSE